MIVGIDAHKRSCTASTFDESYNLKETFEFSTTRNGVSEFMERVPEGSTVVIEASTTGKTLSRMLSAKYAVHMITSSGRKPQIKTDKRDSVKMVKEDALGYVSRCYIPNQYIEGLRFLSSNMTEIGHKASMVKNQIHALLERNMVQDQFHDLSDIFGVEGLERLANLELPHEDSVILAMYLNELELYAEQHDQLEQEINTAASNDEDCRLLMTMPGVGPFVAVTIKARIGDITRFPDKKKLASYAGVVPRASNSGDYVSSHNSVKKGDMSLKYALTLAVNGAVKSKGKNVIKSFCTKQVRKGRPAQLAIVAAARKLANIVWKVLTSRHAYVDEDKQLTSRKMHSVELVIGAKLKKVTGPGDIQATVRKLKTRPSVNFIGEGGNIIK